MTDAGLRAALMEFLQENGWKREISKDGQVIRFRIVDPSLDRPVNIYFSIGSEKPDIIRSEEEEALATIRQFYGIPFEELRHRYETLVRTEVRVRPYPRDFVTSRIPDRHVIDDTIGMGMASSMMVFMRELVSSAAVASSASTSSPVVAARWARAYVDSCRFGHTFRGSFGFQVECPLYEAAQFDLFGVEKPIGRQVSEHIASAMAAVTHAFDEDDIDGLVHAQVPARMCSDLADFLEDAEVNSVTLGVVFDRNVYHVGPGRAEFDIKAASIPMLREAAEKLDPRPTDTPVNVVGRIVELKTSGIPLALDDKSKRTIAIQWDRPQGRQKIRLEVDPAQYAEAIRAHEAGLHVQVRGILTLKGRRGELIDAEPLRVLD